jgi:gliding motility-associated protein GldC
MPPRTAEIKVTVELNDQNLPTGIAWQATEGQEEGETACQAMMLSFWDSETQAVAAIDLWTEEMSIEEMNQYFYQVIHKLADTYLRATKDDAIAREIHAFGEGFGETSGVVGSREQSK